MRRPRESDGSDNVDIVIKSKIEVGDHLAPSTTNYRVLATLFVSLLLDLLGFTVILPLFPAILEYYGQHDDQVIIQ